jgi:hypothetical protein
MGCVLGLPFFTLRTCRGGGSEVYLIPPQVQHRNQCGMSPIATEQTSRDVSYESIIWGEADITPT